MPASNDIIVNPGNPDDDRSSGYDVTIQERKSDGSKNQAEVGHLNEHLLSICIVTISVHILRRPGGVNLLNQR